jgi:hypothetical protein
MLLLYRENEFVNMEINTVKKIVNFGDRYIEEYLTEVYDREALLTDWWEGLQFFLSHSFYQGRNDDVSEMVEEKAMNALKEFIAQRKNVPKSLLEKENFIEIENGLKAVIGKGKIGRRRDIDMVLSILTFVSNLKEKNIVKYSKIKITEGKIEEHFDELDEIVSIGPKIASFYLRDVACMYSLDKYISKEELVYLSPIDTWVRQVSLKAGIINDPDEDDEIVREKIVKTCSDLKIPVIKFNQGAWYLGGNAFDILIENLDKI